MASKVYDKTIIGVGIVALVTSSMFSVAIMRKLNRLK